MITTSQHYPIPPMFSEFALDFRHKSRSTEPSGPLAPYCYKRTISAESIWKASFSCECPELRPAADAVRAWIIPHIIDYKLKAADSDALPDALFSMLKTTMPDVFWHQVDYSALQINSPDCVLGKYGFLHTLFPTPPNGEEAMILELFGRVVSVKGISKDKTKSWLMKYAYKRVKKGQRPFIDQPFGVRIKKAIWANIAWTHIGVPFYL